MTSDTGAVARIVDGQREILARYERRLAEAVALDEVAVAARIERLVMLGREFLAVAEAQR